MLALIQTFKRRPALAVILGMLACVLTAAGAPIVSMANQQNDNGNPEKPGATRPPAAAQSREPAGTTMQVYYLEIVTKDVEGICAAYTAAAGAKFGGPDAGLGNARTASLPGGGMVGVRAPMRESEEPIVRPYWLVKDIKKAVAAAKKAGGKVAMEPTEIPGHGTFAIYVQGGVDHGLWQK